MNCIKEILRKAMKDRDLSVYSKIILAYLCSKPQNSFQEKCLSIANNLNINEKTLAKHMKILEEAGYIKVERHMFCPNRYTLRNPIRTIKIL